MKTTEQAIPSALQTVFDEIKNQTSWLHSRWMIYRQLYGTNERRLDLLNECAPIVFYILQFSLLDDIVLTLCRLAGPRKSVGKDNMCLAQLIHGIRQCRNVELAKRLDVLWDDLQAKCSPLQDRRNRWIAHRDFNTALEQRPQPGVSRRMIEEALHLLRDFVNHFEHHFLGSTTLFEKVILPSDAEDLICCLKQAVGFDDLEKEDKIDSSLWMEGRYSDA